MTPALLLILLLASVSAGLAHLIWGRTWRQIPIFWLAAVAGCLVIYVSDLHLPISLPRPAGVPVLEAVLAAWALLMVASRLRL